jgi:hypothetical protein
LEYIKNYNLVSAAVFLALKQINKQGKSITFPKPFFSILKAKVMGLIPELYLLCSVQKQRKKNKKRFFTS